MSRLDVLAGMIADGSTDPFVWYARAMELRSLGRAEEALEAYAGVADRFPDYVATYLMAAQVAEELDRVDEARSWLEKGIAIAHPKGESHAVAEMREALEALDDR